MKYGPTGYELTYIKPHVVRISHQKEMSWREFFTWMLFIAALVGLTLFIHSFEPSTPVAHADTYVSDREQEKEYCTAWATSQKKVKGGTDQQIRNHCAKYL